MKAIHIRDLSYRYNAKVENIFDQLSCEFDSGCVWWIRGKNGSGKTTFLRHLSGNLIPFHGGIRKGSTKFYRDHNVVQDPSRIFFHVQHVLLAKNYRKEIEWYSRRVEISHQNILFHELERLFKVHEIQDVLFDDLGDLQRNQIKLLLSLAGLSDYLFLDDLCAVLSRNQMNEFLSMISSMNQNNRPLVMFSGHSDALYDVRSFVLTDQEKATTYSKEEQDGDNVNFNESGTYLSTEVNEESFEDAVVFRERDIHQFVCQDIHDEMNFYFGKNSEWKRKIYTLFTLENFEKKKLENLSLGQKAWIHLALCFHKKKSRIVFYDPFFHLDRQHRKYFQCILNEMRECFLQFILIDSKKKLDSRK
ncbi:MAG: ATP-binding cassette domain-containing protein [Bdellovibrionota bacterium]